MSFAMLTDSELMPARRASDGPEVEQGENEKQDEAAHRHETLSDPARSLSVQMETSARLFEILSSRSDIDHPICTDCTELLLTSLKSRLDESTKERDAYIHFLKSLNTSVPSAAEVSKAQASTASSKAAEAKAFAELQELEKEKAGLDDEIAALEAEALALDEEEEAFWRSRNAFEAELSRFQNERDALEAACEHDAQQLEQLRRTNVYNDALYITFDGTFATINGLRLGRLPPKHNVDWAEINAAWGYAALLLATVTDKLGFVLRGYTIKPMGSTSHIEQDVTISPQSSTRDRYLLSSRDQKSKGTVLDLFSSGDIPFAGGIIHRRINNGMVAFLECLRQVGEFIEHGSDESAAQIQTSPRQRAEEDDQSSPTGRRLPYRIKNDKIGNDPKKMMSIKLNANSDPDWTIACKYTLTCCKYLLAVMGKDLETKARS